MFLCEVEGGMKKTGKGVEIQRDMEKQGNCSAVLTWCPEFVQAW
jgi:hypothetical protein